MKRSLIGIFHSAAEGLTVDFQGYLESTFTKQLRRGEGSRSGVSGVVLALTNSDAQI